MNRLIVTLALALAAVSAVAAPHPHRSAWQRTLFVRAHACPATGLHKLPCHGWIIDHTKALCVGGPDLASNMQWQTVAEAKAKDRVECKKSAR